MPLFRGFAIETHPTRLHGFGIERSASQLLGVGIEIQVEPAENPGAPLQTNAQAIACPGKVVEPKLILTEPTGGVYLQILNEDYQEVMHLNSGGFVGLPEIEWKVGGGQENAAKLEVRDAECKTSICLDGEESSLIAGCEYQDGTVEIRNHRNEATVHLDGKQGQVTIGGDGQGGQLWLLGENGNPLFLDPQSAPFYMDGNTGTFTLNGNVFDGGVVHLRRQGEETLRVDYMQGVMEIQNADFAEEFEVAPGFTRSTLQPGMVVVLDNQGKIGPCGQIHDKKAIGILSGAGTYKPGIVMDKQNTANLRLPVALAGKVWCRVETRDHAIQEGDLLTTSPLSGHARKAGGLREAMGAVIGKALKPLPQGSIGLIPVKVGLM